uniref:Cytochrome P450 n=1 Tax=Glossina pallidipes TaxID=7398 RepID=A0A1B0A008_GLOPL
RRKFSVIGNIVGYSLRNRTVESKLHIADVLRRLYIPYTGQAPYIDFYTWLKPIVLMLDIDAISIQILILVVNGDHLQDGGLYNHIFIRTLLIDLMRYIKLSIATVMHCQGEPITNHLELQAQALFLLCRNEITTIILRLSKLALVALYLRLPELFSYYQNYSQITRIILILPELFSRCYGCRKYGDITQMDPAALMSRVCNQDVTYELKDGKKLEIKKDDVIWILTAGLHRDSAYYENPEKFDPERLNEANFWNGP